MNPTTGPQLQVSAVHQFDKDTRVEQTGEQTWISELSPLWNIGEVPNGGYQMSVVARAIQAAVDKPDPLVLTGYYVGRTSPGPAQIEVEVFREGRSTVTAMATLSQSGEEKTRFMATFADHEQESAVEDVIDGKPPVAHDREDLVRMPIIEGVTPTILKQFRMDLEPEIAGWVMGNYNKHAVQRGLLRFAEDRDFDVWSLPLVCDAFPPAWFSLKGVVSWVPTLEFTVQIRNRPVPGPLSCQFTSRFVTNGYLEEDGEVWDSSGQLVAISRQTARVLK